MPRHVRCSTLRGRQVIARVVDEEPVGDITGPSHILTVEWNGTSWNIDESDAKPLPPSPATHDP